MSQGFLFTALPQSASLYAQAELQRLASQANKREIICISKDLHEASPLTSTEKPARSGCEGTGTGAVRVVVPVVFHVVTLFFSRFMCFSTVGVNEHKLIIL